MLEGISPGDTLVCTIAKRPLRQDVEQTIRRLMRQDADIRRALKKAQEHRRRTLVVRSRGKRPWAVREKAAKVARIEPGSTWSFAYSPLFAADLNAVSDFIEVRKG